MLQSLLNNLTLLTTGILFGHIVKSALTERLQKALGTRLALGIVSGLLGVLLMHYHFQISRHIVVDFRQLPILISVYLGGGISGAITTLLIMIYRLFLHEFGTHAVIAALNSPVTFLIGVLFLRKEKTTMPRLFLVLGLSSVSMVVIAWILYDGFPYLEMGLYLPLFFIAGVIAFSILHYLRNKDDSIRKMREAANRDFLTSLYNSRAFAKKMEQKIAAAQRDNIPFTLLIIDIDYFKRVNDQYGHLAGDAVLLQIADVMRETFSQRDHIARKGGEEFVILVDRCDADQIKVIAERLRRNVENHLFVLPDGEKLKLTISGGSATYPNVDEVELFLKADQALYRAKEAGRNRVYVT
ncbi:GGDEF domain-containing protein [Paenibacillus barengoltzii]|uniref:Diguanylate cyclase (GGDEF) domain-containing protein n=1 Tax=Paenibacillus barengoltzii G22 TaxID=1235795 RepID=R9LA45_9BACL|nr:diguanylate cyclase [Paenibacillus barengoltzii]EOS55649.1 diguanylate cyclase (GGDEF) domain-containing protein [Paenibacillus barengoltzii G22]